MLQALSDFFLLISKDGEKITNKDISTFYNFIIKKMPQIEQQFPSIIIKSLEIHNKKCEKPINLKELKDNNDSKKIFNHFQRQIIYLFNDLIDYCYKEGIIKVNDKFEKLIKAKIDDIIKEKKYKNNVGINSKYNNNNLYGKDLFIQKTKKDELRNFLILLIINGDLNFNICPIDYIKFFNSENKTKNRLNTEQFMKYIKTIMKIYKENKKKIKKRIDNKGNNTTDKKAKKERKDYNINENTHKTEEKNNKTEEKNNKNDGKKKNSGIIIFNTDSKIVSLCSKNNNNIYKQIPNNLKNYKDLFTSSQTENKYNKFSNNNNFNNKYNKQPIKKDQITQKLESLSDRSIIINNDNSNEYDECDDEINDTIKCVTPKNIYKEPERNKKINLGRLILNSEQNLRRYSADKKDKNVNKRLTISTIPSKNLTILNLKENKKRLSEYNSSKKFSNLEYQKQNLINRNKKNKEENNLQYKSFGDKNILKNNIIKRNCLDDRNKPINKSQSIIGKNIFEKELINIEKISKNNFNKMEIEKKTKNILNDSYNLVSQIRKDKNNNEYKELYLYKNKEIHQHLVIFNEEERQEKKYDEEDDIRCIIY